MSVTTFKGFEEQDEVSWGVVETPLALSSSVTPDQSALDFIVDVELATGVDNNCALSIPASATVENLTQGVCTIANGVVSRVTDGTCNIDISIPGSKRRFTREMLRSGGSTIYTQTGFATGSLAKHIADNIDAMISGKTPGAATQRLFNADGSRNSSIFSGALDLSASSVGGREHLISPRHFIGATHACARTGQQVTWLDTAGVSHKRTVLGHSDKVGATAPYIGTDVTVGILDAAIEDITPFHFLPSNWQDYMPLLQDETNYGRLTVPMLSQMLDNVNGGRILHILPWRRRPASWVSRISYDPDGCSDPTYQPWSSAVIGGDSGSSMFVPIEIGGVLKTVLLCAIYTTVYSEDVAKASVIANIQATMRYLAQVAGDPNYATYAPPTIDLSLGGFTNYA